MNKHINPLVVVTIVGAALVAGLGATACAPTSPGPVRVVMEEWNIKLSTTSVPVGKVTFDVVNQGKLEHELVILKTGLAIASLQMRAEDSKKVDEEAGAENIGEIEDIEPGKTKSETFDLAPGKYVLICNVAEHYKSGMAVAFEVK